MTNWIPVQTLPDAEQTVLAFCPKEDPQVWLGYHDGDNGWMSVDAYQIEPTHWAEMPEGPK